MFDALFGYLFLVWSISWCWKTTHLCECAMPMCTYTDSVYRFFYMKNILLLLCLLFVRSTFIIYDFSMTFSSSSFASAAWLIRSLFHFYLILLHHSIDTHPTYTHSLSSNCSAISLLFKLSLFSYFSMIFLSLSIFLHLSTSLNLASVRSLALCLCLSPFLSFYFNHGFLPS